MAHEPERPRRCSEYSRSWGRHSPRCESSQLSPAEDGSQPPAARSTDGGGASQDSVSAKISGGGGESGEAKSLASSGLTSDSEGAASSKKKTPALNAMKTPAPSGNSATGSSASAGSAKEGHSCAQTGGRRSGAEATEEKERQLFTHTTISDCVGRLGLGRDNHDQVQQHASVTHQQGFRGDPASVIAIDERIKACAERLGRELWAASPSGWCWFESSGASVQPRQSSRGIRTLIAFTMKNTEFPTCLQVNHAVFASNSAI